MNSPKIVIYGNAVSLLEQFHATDFPNVEITPVPSNYPVDRLDYLSPIHMVVLTTTDDSEDILEQIRSLRRDFGMLPVILASSNPDPHYLVQAYRYGITDCLLAPVDEDQINSLVTTYLTPVKQQSRNHITQFVPDWAQAQWNPYRLQQEADIAANFLGTFRLFRKGTRIDLPGGVRQRSLLAYLFYHGQKRIHRDKIIQRFWPDHDPDCAKNNLNVAICNLRRFLEKYFKQDIICFQNGYFFINSNLKLHCDVDDFLQAFHRGKEMEGHGQTEQAAQWFQTAAKMGTEFLEEFQQEEWTTHPREEFTEKLFHALDALSTFQQERNQYDDALETLRSMLYKDDCLESVHCKIMACYLALGKNEKAVRQYYECGRILSEKLNMRPSAETEALFQDARGIKRA